MAVMSHLLDYVEVDECIQALLNPILKSEGPGLWVTYFCVRRSDMSQLALAFLLMY